MFCRICLFANLAFLPAVCVAESRPNIVVILADDLGYSDVGCYGGEISTPSLDSLAREGLRFTQFYNCAKCVQSRATLLSGLYHHQSNNCKLRNHVTIAEVLQTAGYATSMVGKWHLPLTPRQRGFDRFFGFVGIGHMNYFTGQDRGKNVMRLDDDPYDVPSEGFYATDAFTDYAIQFVEEAVGEQRPFFLYVAYNAPHFPLHAPEKDIQRHRGKYLDGWDAMRASRFARMRAMGLLEPEWSLTPRDAIVPSWKSLDDSQKPSEDLLMAVYAAMVDRVDQNVGRLAAALERLSVADNTLVMFLSDNGACPYSADVTPDIPPGPAESYRSYNSEWANASNTPFRLYKQYSHEGGIASPMIVRWPDQMRNSGVTTDQVGHLIDLMPTILEVSGAEYPSSVDGRRVLPAEGISLMPVLLEQSQIERVPIFWEFRGSHAVREGKWKLVAERGKDWELYDMTKDRSEVNDLAARNSERVARMAGMYENWAQRTGGMPHGDCMQMGPNLQKR